MTQTATEFPTPNLDMIPDIRWFITRYDMFQIAETNMLISNKIWITAKRKQIPVPDMGTQHIRNCINCFNGIGKVRIPSHYLGGKSKWLTIFYQELLNR